MRSILCYLLFAIGGTVTYVCAEEKEQIGSDTLENILFVDDCSFFTNKSHRNSPVFI